MQLCASFSGAMTMNKTANSTQEMAARLRHGLRPTRQRIRLASLLLDGQDRHVSPENVYDQLKCGVDKLCRGTVYNTLRQFCDAGLLNEVHGGGDTLVYDTNLTNIIIF